jgi:hypothetical protein
MDCMAEILRLLLLNKWRMGGGLFSDYLHLSHKEEITIIAVLLIFTLLGTAAKLWTETSKPFSEGFVLPAHSYSHEIR